MPLIDSTSMFARVAVCVLIVVASASSSSYARADDPATTADFIRIDVDAERADRALQVAVVRYRKPGARASNFVDLVGVVHVGDALYYEELNASFRQYDTLLFELIAPNDLDTSRGLEPGSGFISGAQRAMKDALGLEFQLEHIDYSATNFVHADFSPDQLKDSMRERGESLYVYFWRAFYAGMSDYARDPLGLKSVELLSALAASDDSARLRKVFARELIRSDAMLDAFGGDEGSALIEARNEHAMQVFDDKWQAGRRRLGIFYGAAHMPDFDARLRQRGFEPVETRWLDAWQIEDGE